MTSNAQASTAQASTTVSCRALDRRTLYYRTPYRRTVSWRTLCRRILNRRALNCRTLGSRTLVSTTLAYATFGPRTPPADFLLFRALVLIRAFTFEFAELVAHCCLLSGSKGGSLDYGGGSIVGRIAVDFAHFVSDSAESHTRAGALGIRAESALPRMSRIRAYPQARFAEQEL